MPKLSIEATKMSAAKVTFISLVERGANRIPFKIMKQENNMAGKFAGLDLGAMFARKAEKPEVQVVGVVTLKNEGFDSVKGQVEEAGFSVGSSIDMEDSSVVFAQVDKAEGDGTVVRLSEHVALVTKGFSPYNMDVTSGEVSFADKCRAQGFYPGIRTAMETAADSVISLAYASASPEESAKAASKLLDEVKAYVVSLINGLPQKAFKLEEVFPEESEPAADPAPAAKTDDPAADPAPAEPVPADPAADPATTVEKKDKPKTVCKSCGTEMDAGTSTCPECGADPMAEPAAKPKKDKATKEEDSLTHEQVSAIVATKMDEAFGALTSKLETLISSVQTGVSASVQEVSKQVTELAGRVEKAEAASTSVASTLKGTLVGGSDTQDHVTGTKKSEPSREGREIDTAFMGSVRKRAK